jgi:hypothetical protein
VVRKELKERGNLPENANYPAQKQIFHLTRLLKIFYRSITRPNSLVPRARLSMFPLPSFLPYYHWCLILTYIDCE